MQHFQVFFLPPNYVFWPMQPQMQPQIAAEPPQMQSQIAAEPQMQPDLAMQQPHVASDVYCEKKGSLICGNSELAEPTASLGRKRRRKRGSKARTRQSRTHFRVPVDLQELSELQRMCFEAKGCREVQRMLCETSMIEAQRLAEEALLGIVAPASTSPYANFVIQAAIRRLPEFAVPFVAEELLTQSPPLAFHEYGCRLYCRMIEVLADDEVKCVVGRKVDDLMQAHIFSDLDAAITNEWARHIVCLLLEKFSQYRGQIREQLLLRWDLYRKNDIARLVLRTAIHLRLL